MVVPIKTVFNPCPAEFEVKIPHPFLIVSQSDSLIRIVDINFTY